MPALILCGDQCQHRCLAKQGPHLPHNWLYTSSGGGHELASFDPDDTSERNVKQHQCPGVKGDLDVSSMDPLTAELEKQAYDAEWDKIRRLSQPAFGPPKAKPSPGKYNAQISSKPGEPLEFTVDLPDNHTDDDMFEAMHEAARKAGLA